jgi:putative DNA primase/helicase
MDLMLHKSREELETKQNINTTCTTYTNNDESLINNEVQMVEVEKSTYTTPIPSYTNKLQGEERLTGDEVSILASMNKEFSHIIIGGKHKIVGTKHCPVNGMTATFEDVSQFHRYFEHEKKVQGLNRGKAWLQWESKSFYPRGVGFYPNKTKCPYGVYNFFSGLALKPIEGDCSLYLNHIEACICDGDKVASKYLVQWLAHMVQKPEEKPSVAVLMKSEQGTGKGLFTKPLLSIFGQFGAHVNGHENLTQRFNGTVANKILIFGDEVDLKDKRVADKLKGLISERVIQLERKGIEPEPMPNYSRFIFASNHVQVISAGLKERRYLIVEPVLKDKPYYDAIGTWIKRGGASHLYHYLQRVDITDFNPNKAPITNALIDEKMCNLPLAMDYIYSEIKKEKPFEGKTRVFSIDLVSGYELWLEDKGKPSQTEPTRRSHMGKAMKSLSIESMGRSGRDKGVYYEVCNYDMMKRFNDFIST